MITLDWNQVNAWRLAQHALLERAACGQMLEIVRQIGALQAQVMSAAELQLWARVQDISPADVQNALWKDRTLLKMWAMRGTLHLLASDDLPLYVGALSTFKRFQRQSWQKYFGVSLDEFHALFEGIRTVLNGAGMTREQLAEALGDHTKNPKLREHLLSGWGTLLKPVAFQGYLCFGPNRGQNVTFVQPEKWIGKFTVIDSEQAFKKIGRRFLTTYGPATTDEFARWFGMEASRAKKTFKALGDEIAEVNVEGWKAWMLVSSLKQMDSLKAPHTVRLLPLFDPYTMAVARHSQYLLPEAHKVRVYRPQGWISQVVLVNGRIEGVWEHEKQRAQVTLNVELFSAPKGRIKDGVEAEAKRLGEFLNTSVQVTYA